MKKAALLFLALLSALSLSACNGAAKGPVYNFSSANGAAFTPYAVEYEDTLYFTTFYDELYSYRDGAVTLLETEFDVWSMTLWEDALYYCANKDWELDGFYRRTLSEDGLSLGEPEKLYDLSGSESYPNAAWTDGKHIFFLNYDGLLRVNLSDGTETLWNFQWASGSLLVYDHTLYLNAPRNDPNPYHLFAVDLDNGEIETVTEESARAMGVQDGKPVILYSNAAPRTLPFTDGFSYYLDGTEVYTKEGEEYIYACTIPIQGSLLDPQFLTVGDNLLMRSFYPADLSEIDHNLPGSDMTDTKIYQYLLTPDGELTLLLADDVRFPLA